MAMLRITLFIFILFNLSACQSINFGGVLSAEPKGEDIDGSEMVSMAKPNNFKIDNLLDSLAKEVGLRFSPDDQKNGQKALESNYTNQTSEWIDEINKVVLSVTPTRTFTQNNAIHCRDYKATATIGLRELAINAVACRQGDGLWFVQP